MNTLKRDDDRDSRERARKLSLLGTAAIAALTMTAMPATAQQDRQQSQQGQQSQATQGRQQQGQAQNRERANRLVIIDLDEGRNLPEGQRARRVTAEDLYLGVRASRIMSQEVFGGDGNELGDVQDIFVGRDGRVSAIVVEAGGFLDIGDAAFRMPWNEVNLTPGAAGIQVKMTEETASSYGLFDGPETLLTGTREYRLSELIGDYARLSNGAGFGRVSDVVIGPDGRISGVLVTRDIGWGGGAYGYPYYGYGYGFDPGNDYYGLPHATTDAAALAPRIDYGLFDDGIL
jgi:sporulation protein YlmC with PRC-barrel domain